MMDDIQEDGAPVADVAEDQQCAPEVAEASEEAKANVDGQAE
ncbi:MAG: hypothetical protein Q8P56_02850 [Candidatus Uhrbacteria bacterium]|nr:hypothetical protein [Candidatus Uhrbacteria bacterium]